MELERAITRFLGTEDTLLHASGYHANTGLLESLLSDRDYVFADGQIEPALADGVRLCRARVLSYRSNDMDHLEDRLKRSRQARFRAIVTPGVFPLDGVAANLGALCALAERYDAVVAVDDAHGIGVLGKTGRGTPEAAGVSDRIDVVTGTFGHALGGGAGGFCSGRKEIVGWLRQKSRPYLASTAPPPAAAAAALKAIGIAAGEPKLREQLRENARFFRTALTEAGFRVIEGEHPAVAVILGDAVTTQKMADHLFRGGVFAMGFCHPVVAEGTARLRALVSARHTQKTLKAAVTAMAQAARDIGLIMHGGVARSV